MNIRVVSVLCPKCGAGVNFYEKDRVIKCHHCNTNFIPIHSEGVERYYFEAFVRNPQIKVQHFLKQKEFKRNEYKIVDIDHFFIPVWKAIGQVTGWISGLSPRKTVLYTEMVTGPNGTQIPIKRKRETGGIPLKKLMRMDKEMLLNAVHFPDLRWSKEEVSKVEYSSSLEVYNEEKMNKWGKILTPDLSPKLEKKQLLRRFIKSALSLYINYEPLKQRLKVIGLRVFLYYFPVSLFKVELNNQLICLTVNGVSGKVTTNKIFKKEFIPKRKKNFLSDILLIMASSFISTSLIVTKNPTFAQIGIVLVIFTFIFIIIKR